MTYPGINVLQHINSFTSDIEQAKLSLVCSDWRNSLLSSNTDFAKCTRARRMALNSPAIFKIISSFDNTNPIRFYEKTKKHLLLSKNDNELIVVDTESKKSAYIDLTELLNDTEKNHPTLKVQKLQSAFFIATTHIATLTENGTLGFWDLSTSKCTGYCQLNSNENLEYNERTNSILNPHTFAKLFNKTIYFESLLAISTLDIDLQKPSPGEVIPIKQFEGNKKYFNLKNMSPEQIFFSCDTNFLNDFFISWPLNQRPQKIITSSNYSNQSVVAVSDKWVVVANCYAELSTSNLEIKSSTIDEAVTSHIVYQVYTTTSQLQCLFEVDYQHFSKKSMLDLIQDKQHQWLCNDFIAVWKGESIELFSITKQKQIASINLKTLLTNDEMKLLRVNEYARKCPILNVEIDNNEIVLTIQTEKESEIGPAVKLVRYTVESQKQKLSESAKQLKQLTNSTAPEEKMGRLNALFRSKCSLEN